MLSQSTGSDTYRYIHAQRGIFATQDASGWEYMLQDGLGSVRNDGMSYDPYGKPTGGYGEGFGFTGEYTDTNELLYLRARYYAPQIGLFTALDPFEGMVQSPMSLNGYSWVEGNAPNAIDPSGMCLLSLGEWGCVLNGNNIGAHLPNSHHFVQQNLAEQAGSLLCNIFDTNGNLLTTAATSPSTYYSMLELGGDRSVSLITRRLTHLSVGSGSIGAACQFSRGDYWMGLRSSGLTVLAMAGYINPQLSLLSTAVSMSVVAYDFITSAEFQGWLRSLNMATTAIPNSSGMCTNTTPDILETETDMVQPYIMGSLGIPYTDAPGDISARGVRTPFVIYNANQGNSYINVLEPHLFQDTVFAEQVSRLGGRSHDNWVPTTKSAVFRQLGLMHMFVPDSVSQSNFVLGNDLYNWPDALWAFAAYRVFATHGAMHSLTREAFSDIIGAGLVAGLENFEGSVTGC